MLFREGYTSMNKFVKILFLLITTAYSFGSVEKTINPDLDQKIQKILSSGKNTKSIHIPKQFIENREITKKQPELSYLDKLKKYLTSVTFLSIGAAIAIICIFYGNYQPDQNNNLLTNNWCKELPKILKSIKIEKALEAIQSHNSASIYTSKDGEQALLLDDYFNLGNDANSPIKLHGEDTDLAQKTAFYGLPKSFATILNHGYKLTPELMFSICDPHNTGKEPFLPKNLMILKIALEKKPNLGMRDNEGKTLLHRVKDHEAQALLITAGADIHATDNNGNTPQLTYRNQINQLIIKHIPFLQSA